MKKIFIIDADESFQKTVAARFNGEGLEYEVFSTASEALIRMTSEIPAVVFLDYNIPDRSSVDVLKEILRINPDTRVIIVASGVVEESGGELITYGAADYVVKPVNLNKLVSIAKKQIERNKIVEEGNIKSRAWWRKSFDFIGIHFPVGKDDVIHVSKRIYYSIGIFFAVVIVGSIGFIQFSMSPTFCNSCHIMRPYYDMWKNSRHNTVACVDCHYPPGFREEIKGKFQAATQVVKFLTGTYSTKPYAQIEDASCLRTGCHATRLLSGKVLFKKGIVFDHTPHLTQMRGGIKLRCTSCHSQIVQGSHIAVTETTCFTCHFNGLEKDPSLWETQAKCTICHEIPTQDIQFESITYNHQDFAGKGVACQKCHLEVVKGLGEVPKEFCVTCHGEPERLAKYNDFEFLHKHHVTDKKVECTRCHTEIKHSVKTSVKPLEYSCDICHKDKHTGQKELYMGISGRGVEKMPSPMFIAQVDCIGCHVNKDKVNDHTQFDGFTLRPSEDGCISCHGNDYKGILKDWKDSVNAQLKETKALLSQIAPLVGGAPDNIKKLYDDAKYNIEFVEYSKGVHNIDYAIALLDKSKEYINQAREMLFKKSQKSAKL
ncbi:MAG: response regulator [Candidatus Schekmanbacteria bacterium]|nr:response regulator [Candidatus Schekmanbacteria bacterium]